MTLPLCESLQKKHPDLVACESNENLLQELVTNFSEDDKEAAFQQLASTGSLALKATAEMEAEAAREAEYQRSKAERARRMAYSDDIRRLKKSTREEGEAILRQRRKAEAEAKGKSEEQKALEAMTPEELRAKIRAEDESKGHVRGIRQGSEADGIW